MMAFSKLFWLLVAFNIELLASFSIDCQELWVKISRVDGASFISPGGCVCVIKRQLHGNFAISLVHLKLFWHWGLYSSLQFFNLLSIKSIIVKHLPLLNGSLVEVTLALSDLLLTDNFLDPVFKLDKHLTSKGVLGRTANVAFAEGMHHLVILVFVSAPVLVITFQSFQLFRCLFKGCPQLSKFFCAVQCNASAC